MTKAALALVFCGALASLWVRAWDLKISDTLLDPTSRIDAQDEALYAHSAIRMVEKGGWLTPVFLGRYNLYKPPLLFWLAGLSASLLGISGFALRLPNLLAGAAAACLVFAWVSRNTARKTEGAASPVIPWAAVAGAVLLVSDHLWQVLASLCLTDGLLMGLVTGTMFCLLKDPRLESAMSRWAFSLLTAAAVLDKSVAGALPIVILLAFAAMAKPQERPSLKRIAQICLVVTALSLPWYLYQLVVHTQWFWSEHFGSEILTYGLASPTQTSAENPVLFYLRRLWAMDPVLSLAALAAAPAMWSAWRRRETPAVLLAAWIAVVLGAAAAWSYRNTTYLGPAMPALAILAASYGPAVIRKRPVTPAILSPVPRDAVASSAAVLLLLVKAGYPAQAWGLEFRPGILHPSVPLLSEYSRRGRNHELILVEPADGFYSAVLPLPRVRYCFLGPAGGPLQDPLDYAYLGIQVSAEQFNDLPRWQPVFRDRLRVTGLNSDEAVATVVIARSRSEVAGMVAAHSSSDFFLPRSYQTELWPLAAATHDLAPASADWFFLLSKSRLAYFHASISKLLLSRRSAGTRISRSSRRRAPLYPVRHPGNSPARGVERKS